MTEAKGLTALQLALLAQQADEQRRLLAAEPIAIVGMGLRFPSGPQRSDLESPECFWQWLLDGHEAIAEVPSSRWQLENYYNQKPGQSGKMHCRHGAFLNEIHWFDAIYFGISPKEAKAIDPQHRLLLEVACEALERAGLAPAQLRGMTAGAFFGLCTTDYAWRQLRQSDSDSIFDLYFATGTTFSMAPGRLAHALGLRGAALAIDTACSSSLVAVDLACRSLRDRSTDLALAGGASLMLSPINSLCFSRSGMMANDGHCKTFDAAADGYVRGEGCGVVVLKRLADAITSGDPILAVIRGSAVNQDGASAGLTVPNGEAQMSLLQQALEQAQLKGNDIDVLEAHGTGTALGDPIELKALAPIYASPERSSPLRLGSVKTNLGHLEGAAGVAGLIKAVLMVQKGQIPPHLHLNQPTPYFNWKDWALHIPTSTEPWPQHQAPRRVAVSSFGFSGTNAHVVVEQAPPEVLQSAQTGSGIHQESSTSVDWLMISARTPESLRSFAQRMLAWLPTQEEGCWAAICATSRVTRTSQRCRLVLQAHNAKEAIQQLESWLARCPDAKSVLSSTPAIDGVDVAEAPAQSPRLAFQLTSQSRTDHWHAWQDHAVQASALLFEAAQAPLARELTGDPPQLRLIVAGANAASELKQHGYSLVEPLAPPSLAALARLWLAGHPIDWSPSVPSGRWQKTVLPPTPFDRQYCWIDEPNPSPAQLSVVSRATGGNPFNPADADLEHHWVWGTPTDGRFSGTASTAPLLLLGARSELAQQLGQQLSELSLNRPLQAVADLEELLTIQETLPVGTEVLVATAALSPNNHGHTPLGLEFWQIWLPILQHLIQQSKSLGAVHWWLPNDASPDTHALTGLVRCWAQEVGPQAGAVLQAENLSDLALLLSQPASALAAARCWRIRADCTELAELIPAAPSSGERQESPSAPNGTVLITGGLGSLGLAAAEQLSRWGVNHLILVSRHAPTEEQRQKIAALTNAGVHVDLESIDVSDARQVKALCQRLEASPRPLAGIIHTAGVLDDGLLNNLTPERCAAATAAKVKGALNLDRYSRALQPQFFIVYSSLAASLGSPGQCPYGAANGFLEGLICERRRQNLPGLALAWGPWAGGGMAAQAQAAIGIERLSREEGQALLQRWLTAPQPQECTMVLARLNPAEPNHPMVCRLRQLAAELKQLQAEQAQKALEDCLAELLIELGGFDRSTLTATTRLDELGLDSLMAVELASIVQAGFGVNLGLGALVGEPTLGQMARHLQILLKNPDAVEKPAINLAQEAQLPADLLAALDSITEAAEASATAETSADHGSTNSPEAILLTGATGFLGAFLLADQLERHPTLTVYCLVRADGVSAARSRLQTNLEHYGLWKPDWNARVVAVPGDLAQPSLGLDTTTWDNLAQRLDGILHNGAQLSYVAPYGQLHAANVAGTLEILKLATAPAIMGKAAIPLEYISSTAVFEATAYRGQTLDENTDLIEWQGIYLGYSQTKWVSERLVVAAAKARLPVRIYRPPLITGHSHTGAWHEQDFLHRLVRGCLALHQAPAMAMELDLVPVDYVTAAVGAMAWQPVDSSPDVLHVQHPKPILWSELLDGLIAQGAPLAAVDFNQWLKALSDDPTNPLYPLQPFFTHRWGPEQLTYPELNQPGMKARPNCTHTRQRLEPLGVNCPGLESLILPYAHTFLAHQPVNRQATSP